MRSLFVVVASLLILPVVAFAQNNSAQERKDDQKVKDAQQALSKAKDKLNAEQKELNKAADHLRKMGGEQRTAEVAAGKEREEARKRAEDSPQIRQALADHDKAKAEFEKLSAPLLKALHATPEHQTLVAAADQARGELRGVAVDQKLTPQQKTARLAELNRILNAPNEAEHAALAKDAAAAAAQMKMRSAEKKITETRERNRVDLEKDWKYARALKSLQEANNDMKKAESDLNHHKQEVTKQQREVASKQQNVDQAQRADRQNDNKKKKK